MMAHTSSKRDCECGGKGGDGETCVGGVVSCIGGGSLPDPPTHTYLCPLFAAIQLADDYGQLVNAETTSELQREGIGRW